MEARLVAHPSDHILEAFSLDKLDDAAVQALLAHLEVCLACRGRAARFSGVSVLERLRAARPSAATTPGGRSLGGSHDRTVAPDPDKGAAEPTTSHLPPNLPPELRVHPQYDVLRELGYGGMGVVYLAKNKKMNRLEVLKVVNRQLLGHPAAVERFLREIRSAANLNHANIVTAYAMPDAGDLLVFAMEYVQGEDLAKLVASNGPLSVVRACGYAYQTARGLQHAYDKGMVHRDIKPSNLIVTRAGKEHIVKILDFGLAKATREEGGESHDLTGSNMLGTPLYMAPEQARDAAHADIRADIYSLGCTLYFLLTGRPPFQEKSLFELLNAHQSKEATPLNQLRKDVPAELTAVVAKMMAKELAQRYQKPDEVKKALLSFCKSGDRPLSGRPTPAEGVKVQVPGGSNTVVSPPVAEVVRDALPADTPAQRAKPTLPMPILRETMIEGSATIARAMKKSAARRDPSSHPKRRWGRWLLLGVAAGLLVAGAIHWWPRSAATDPELQRDWDDASRVMMTTGYSLPFYKERGPKRIQSWKRLAESNNPMGMYMYARCLQEGVAVTKDEAEAFKWYRKAADLGNVRAMNALGVAYFEGAVVTKDVTEAVKWYRQAAEARESTAMVNLGYCYLNGTGLTKEEKTGARWFREAAGLGDVRAMNSLGNCYQNGTGVEKDEKEAVQWYRKAAERGNAVAMNNLGECYLNGIGVAKNEKEAVEWYRKAADAESVDAMIRLAEWMVDGGEFITRSPAEALTLLDKARAIEANRGSPTSRIQELQVRAMLRLGQDDLRATRYGEARTRLTAARAASEALNKERPGRFYFMQDLGSIWFELGNLERADGDAKTAADCYRKAMAVDGPGMTKATGAFAELLEKGEGVAQDEAKAKELRAIAAKQKIKRYNIQCKMGENGLSFPVHVYLFEVFPWRHPLETQFCYFREERGFDLPKEEMDKFQRLHLIAKENNVSFTDLCQYALDGEKDEKKDKAKIGKQ